MKTHVRNLYRKLDIHSRDELFSLFDGIGGKLELSDCSKMPLLADALRKEGFTEDEVEAIFFRNAQRFFENNL